MRSNRHPDCPLFRNPLWLETRIVSNGVQFQGEYKTIFGRWRALTHLYHSKQEVVIELESITYGLPEWQVV